MSKSRKPVVLDLPPDEVKWKGQMTVKFGADVHAKLVETWQVLNSKRAKPLTVSDVMRAAILLLYGEVVPTGLERAAGISAEDLSAAARGLILPEDTKPVEPPPPEVSLNGVAAPAPPPTPKPKPPKRPQPKRRPKGSDK